MIDNDSNAADSGTFASTGTDGAPAWMLPAAPAGWPVAPRASADMRYRITLPVSWAETPRVADEGTVAVHWFDGRSPAEWARIAFMPAAEVSADLAAWVDATVAVSGFPVPIATLTPPPRLIEWSAETDAAITRRLGADAALGYVGLAAVHDADWNWLMRLYTLLVRKGSAAWHITLAFETACLPGMDPELIASNDHVRAGATFGDLSLW